MNYARRIDNTQANIVAALEAAGCSVESIAGHGRGVPDLLVGRGQQTYLLECKSRYGTLTKPQEAFIKRWRGRPVAVVKTVDEALEAVGLVKRCIQQYEQSKQSWTAANPNATPREYMEAMRKLADRAGI